MAVSSQKHTGLQEVSISLGVGTLGPPCDIGYMTHQEAFWADHYRDVFQQENPWLDYSNERVQAQTFALCLEGGGPLQGRRCLDVGCGWGQFSTCLASLRAAEVIGADIVESAILSHRTKFPHIRWECGSPTDAPFLKGLGDFDLIFLLESVQYFSPEQALPLLWERLRPAGRMVIVTPNGNCPIVSRVRERFQGNYAPPNLEKIAQIVDPWKDLAVWKARGLHFGNDQRVVPYETTPWGETLFGGKEPNRLQIVLCKAADESSQANASSP